MKFWIDENELLMRKRWNMEVASPLFILFRKDSGWKINKRVNMKISSW